MSRGFVPAERAFLLMRLTQEAPDAVDATHVRLWVKELLQLTDTFPSSEKNKVALRANALKALATVDVKQSLRLFDTIGELDFQTRDDPRAFAAISIFGAAYRAEGPRVVPELRAHAAKLSISGEYPYLAMLPILLAESKRNPATSTDLFSEALRAYERDSNIQQKSNSDFVSFLNGLNNQVPAPLMRQALEVCVSKLLDVKTDGEKYLARVQTEAGSVVFSSENEQMLFELTSLLRQYEPSLLDELKGEHPAATALDGVTPTSIRSESMTVQGDPSAGELHMLQTEGLQRDRLNNILATAPNNPDEAQRQALTLTDAGFRAIAEAAIAQAYASRNTSLYSSAYAQAKGSLPDLPSDRSRLQLLATLAEAAASSNNLAEVRDDVSKGLDLGAELFQQDMDDHPGKAALFFVGFDDLLKLVRVGVKADPDFTLSLVQQTRNAQLQANLLIDAAQGLAERQKALRPSKQRRGSH